MGARLLLPLVLLGLALLAGCSSSGGGLSVGSAPPVTSAAPVTGAPTGTSVPAGAAPASPSGAAAAGDSGPTELTGQYLTVPAVQAFRAYDSARTAALLAGSAESPALIATTSPTRYAQDSAFIADTVRRGWTVSGTPHWSVVGVGPNGAHRLGLHACQWDASFLRVDAQTGQPEEKVVAAWKPHDVEMLQTGGRWVVDQIFAGTFACSGAR